MERLITKAKLLVITLHTCMYIIANNVSYFGVKGMIALILAIAVKQFVKENAYYLYKKIQDILSALIA